MKIEIKILWVSTIEREIDKEMKNINLDINIDRSLKFGSTTLKVGVVKSEDCYGEMRMEYQNENNIA